MDKATVLVTLDGSKFAEAALPYGVLLARAKEATLRLLSVVVTDFDGLFPRRDGLASVVEAGACESGTAYLRETAERLRPSGIEVETETAVGDAAREILRAAQSPGVAFMVIATHGRGTLGRWMLGSVADKVMRLAACPTLLVPPRAMVDESPRLRRLLVPLDGSELAETALPIAGELARATGATLSLVTVTPFLTRVLDWGGEYIPEIPALETEMADRAMERLGALRAKVPAGVQVETEVLRGTAAAELEAYANRQRTDLTIMSTHGRGGISRAMIGSTAERLVHAGIPLLLVRPPVA